MDQLTALRAFVRLVELETFSATAEDLRVKQSTVSKWIAALEDELGVRLVDRTTRSLRVTDAGQRFYRRASAILADYESAVDEVRADADTLRGQIRMSVPVVFGERYVVPSLSRFMAKHERLELDLVLADRYVSLVEEGFDLAIRVGTPVDSSLQSHRIGQGRRRLVASTAYLEKHGTPLCPRDLARHECLIHNERGARATWSFVKSGRTEQVSVGGRIAINHSLSTLQMAHAGLGIALLASWLVDDELSRGKVVSILDEYEPPPAPVQALTPPGRIVAPRVRALLEHLRQELSGVLT